MKEENTLILKVLVGSRAHGLHTEESDYDYRGVFVMPTQELLKIGAKPKNTSWIEGQDDNTSWEIGHFMQMATKCNPTILETFLSPKVESNADGDALRNLFAHVWNTKDTMNAFIGYGLNQRKKFLEKKDDRPHKYAEAYLRTLCLAHELFATNTFTVDMTGHSEFDTLHRWKNKDYEMGEVIDKCMMWQKKVEDAAEKCKKETDIDAANDFLLSIRKKYW